MQVIKALLAHRGFIFASVKREFELKYRNSLLGAAWTIINPLAMILVYTVIFSQVMQAKLAGVDKGFAYSIFLCAGSLTWGLFAEILTRSQNLFIDNANIIKKINFPKLCLPIITVINASVNFIIVFGLFTLFLAITGNFVGFSYLYIFPLLAILIMFALGLGMILGVLNVFFRDVGQFFAILLQFWFWFTPIVYPISALPKWAGNILQYNPMLKLMQGFQNILVYGDLQRNLHLTELIPVTILALVLCIIGYQLFRKCATDMVDEL
jgi:lipopolysaccharide transport system permease protein